MRVTATLNIAYNCEHVYVATVKIYYRIER